LVPYSLSPSSSVGGEEELASTEFHVIQDNSHINEWDGIVNSDEIPFNINNFLSNYFNVEPSTVEQGNVPSSEGDLPLLSPNTLQILEDFTNELTGNPPLSPTDYLLPLQTTEVEHSPNIVEQLGGGGNIQEGGTTFPDFQLSNSILNNIVVFTATFGDPFNSLMGGNFVFDPV
jgi:hypothetical protein